MGLLWVVCGAGRGVGKTRLAHALCRALPEALYVKKGRHTPRRDKEGVYFQKEGELLGFLEKEKDRRAHLVVESNSLVKKGLGDIVIYLGPLESTSSPREDRAELARRARIILEEEPAPRAWRKVLEERLSDPDLVDSVLEALLGMYPRRGEEGFTAKSKIWLKKEGRFVLGPGLAGLLEEVEALGSLRKAASRRGISYRHAWDLFRLAETNLGEALLVKRAGGPGGGGSSLSGAGRRLLGAYRRLEADLEAFAGERLNVLLGEGHRRSSGGGGRGRKQKKEKIR